MKRKNFWKLTCILLSWEACAVATKLPTLPIGTCFAGQLASLDQASFSFGCQLAAFGAYLPQEREYIPVALAPESMLACSPLVSSGEEYSSYEGAAVLVRRGDCSFQEKLEFVVAAGAITMILVNIEDTLIPLSSLEYERNDAVAVSVTQSDGDQLIRLVTNAQQQGMTDLSASIVIRIKSPISLVAQARARLEFLVQINTPVLVYEEYQDFAGMLEPFIGTLDDLLAMIATSNYDDLRGKIGKLSLVESAINKLVEFFSWSKNQLSNWEFASDAAFHASIVAASVRAQSINDNRTLTQDDQLPLQEAAYKLADAGYYLHSTSLFTMISTTSGDILESLSESTACTASEFGKFSSLQVAVENFLGLYRFKKSQKDRECLKQAIGLTGHAKELEPLCCYLVESTSKSKKHTSRKFSSAFTEELFHSLVLMGVFMDELGPFAESLRFFKYAAQLCESDRTTLELRQLLAVPVVFSSQEEMNSFVENLEANIQASINTAKRKQSLHEREVYPLGSVSVPIDANSSGIVPTLRPEEAAYLQYTITPPTMFIGYQGFRVVHIQRAVNKLRTLVYPRLSSSFAPVDPTILETKSHRLRRIGFISTWFRTHSVGKLLLGIVQNLDRSKFHVIIYRCMHFLRDGDEVTAAFKRTADEYVELPEHQDGAVQILRQAELDVVIYPELGMDEWTVLLSHHRVAPIQCVFWGHPITTGNPNIDYFISSEHFISEHFDDPGTVFKMPIVGEDQLPVANLSGYRRSSFSEQIVLFRGLSTIFTEPAPLTAESKAITRSRLYLPTNRRLYLCPQTLMKLHPVFDEALIGILAHDEKATIVLLASKTQAVWVEQLRRRFRRRFGREHRRVLFLPTLPFNEFQALLSVADVILDPFPFGGGVTTLDALHLGIPVVTLPAAQSVVHLAAGFLRYMNASDCISKSLDEYVSLAIAIAEDADDIRSRLLEHRSVIYQDSSTIEDWNKLLSGITPREL